MASVFAGVWRSIKAHEFTHYWFKGGRNSTKSSFISIAIVLLIMLNPEANAVVLRKVGNTLRTSVYEQIGWACDVLGVTHLFDFGLSPMEVTYRPTGQVIRFVGCDKPKKLKSAKFRTGYCAVVWFEEVDEFDGMDEVRSVLATFLRGGDMFWVFYSYNPPRSARNWVNKEARDLEAHPGEDGRFICHTTYLDVIGEHPEWISATALAEAERCLNCKKPFCVEGCPVNINIPRFIEQIRAKDFGGALDTIREDSMLPAICGRVCPQENQCEGKCIRGKKSEPVAIGQLERFLGDRPELASTPKMAPKNGKKVAVVGSGPSGITCAGELARNGFDVTVFEAFFTGGGVLVYGIPEFRLPKAVVKREIDGLEDMGVKFEYNSVVGNMATAEELFEQGFDAIYVATGAGLPKFLNVPGENLPNVFFANEYLTRVNLMKANKFPEYDTPTKHGKNVVVFGGGNVAMDAVRTAKRLGAEHAIIAYRRTEDEMPCRRAELHHAKAEGVEVLPLVSPLEFVAGEDGSVCAVKVQKMELGEPDESGRRRPVPIEGAIEEIPCDVAISAIGTNANPFAAKIGGKMELNKWGYIVADEETGQTTDPRIWAGGDIVTGAATVILAMGAGKKAAASITKSLLGE